MGETENEQRGEETDEEREETMKDVVVPDQESIHSSPRENNKDDS